jgi:PPOX class probable F420-dependent enzyme
MDDLLNGANFAQLGTVNSDGSPHVDTVWFEYDNGRFTIATTMATKKATNLAGNPNAYIVVTNRNNPYEQAQLKVRVIEIEPDVDLAICDRIAYRYTGKPFPQRKHRNRVAIQFDVLSCNYHVARV